MSVSRRSFLKGAAAGAAGTALTGGVLIGGVHADARPVAGTPTTKDSYPFHGANQSGILTPRPAEKQRNACFASFDIVEGTSKAQLADVLKTLSERARTLAVGGPAPYAGIGQTPSDSDVLGPEIPADGLTVTAGFGSTLFDDRFGLAPHKPAKLKPMTVFPNDSLEQAWLGGDLSLQLCANNPDTIHHAIRDITRHTRGALQLRWKIEGYNAPPRPSGSGRNLLGFKDGTANPTGSEAQDLVWVDSTSEPAWAQGGTYQVIRLIRMLVEFWDRVSINEQENMFGRRRDSGAPLDGNTEFDTPNYSADPHGSVIPLDSHIRLANPRTPATENQRLIRRSYSYDLGVDPSNGNLQTGHVFVAYNQDVERQFETVQARLVGEPLVDYVQPFGGGYFFVPPGLADSSDWYGKPLFT